MTSFREHVEQLRAADDALSIEQRVHWADTAAAVAAETVQESGPAVVFEEAAGRVRLVGGAYAARDATQRHPGRPWARLAVALGLGADAGYTALLDALGGRETAAPERTSLAADPVPDGDVRSLGLPAVGAADIPSITLGLLAVRDEGSDDDGDGDDGDGDDGDGDDGDGSGRDGNGAVWAPIRGSIHGSDRVRAVVPERLASLEEGTDVAIALGVPAAALAGAFTQWAGETQFTDAVRLAGTVDDVTVAGVEAGVVPASSEVVLEGVVAETAAATGGVAEPWELSTATGQLGLRIDGVTAREDPLVPFSPTGAALADGHHLMGVVEAARLHQRVNNYWGVAPVEWIAIPAEAKLGICLVASEILYAGFEWQLANTLFSFSWLFDKVLVLDAETPPMDLSRAFDDVWVKAHPSHDWEFSDPDAPAAAAPHYRRDGTTGSNLYIDATWDPRWDEEYIAPRVTFENTYPEEIRRSVRERWTAFGFREREDPDDGGGNAVDEGR